LLSSAHRNSSTSPPVTLHRLLPIAALAGLACTQAAAGVTAQERRLLEVRAAQAPLAVSGDGAWRLHVDAHDVLHRVGVADSTQAAAVQLPPGVQRLSASADGLKVALSTRRQCVGLVDFGVPSGAAAKVSWRPWVVGADGVALGAERAGWVARMPAACGDGPFAGPVAISSDGGLVAAGDAVVDSATNRVVASLPTRGVDVLRLAFVDHDARLLIAAAAPPAAGPGPGRLSFSLWDLASKALVNDIETTGARPAAGAALQTGFSPQTGALFYLDERGRDPAARDAAPDAAPSPLELVQLAPGACGTPPRPRATVGDALGASWVVDPYGRWFASSRPLDAAHDADELATGARWVLVVQDMATGRPLERVTSRYALAGLVATPDGATLLARASQPVEPETGDTIAGWPVVPDGEQVLELKLPDAATTATRDSARAWDRGFCREAGETPGARAAARSEHLLKPLWSRDLGAAALPAQALQARETPCDLGPRADLFRTVDGGLWLDRSTQVARLDPLSGALAPGLATPRSSRICSVVTPTGSGFISAGGDTLTWRPLTAAADAARRRVVERHPGWHATLLGIRDDAVRVLWSDPEGGLRAVDYDSSGKRVHASTTTTADVADGEIAGGRESPPAAPCHDRGDVPLAIGYDWRAGPFGSQRGATCGPLPGMARLVWWSGASIAPRLDDSDPAPRPAPAIDGAIAVAADDGTLHVVNLALQREIAQVDLAGATDARTWVLAARRLVLVESTGADGRRWLRAYALP
jgi:hypothetical protein